MPRRESARHAATRQALARLIAAGTDRDSFGVPLFPGQVKILDKSFAAVPASTWRQLVKEERAKQTIPGPIPGMYIYFYLTNFTNSI